jgi:hypothetical protein
MWLRLALLTLVVVVVGIWPFGGTDRVVVRNVDYWTIIILLVGLPYAWYPFTVRTRLVVMLVPLIAVGSTIALFIWIAQQRSSMAGVNVLLLPCLGPIVAAIAIPLDWHLLPRPRPIPASGWYPDPARRHQYRYWDGTRWSQHVSDDGVGGTDSMPPI